MFRCTFLILLFPTPKSKAFACSFQHAPFSFPDSTGPMSTAHTHPPLMGSMVGHPSVISTSRPLPSPMSTLGSPMNGLASPYPVITSSLGSPSVSLQSTPNMNFGPLSSPQVRHVGVFGRQKITMNCYFPKWLEYKVAFMYP